MIMGIFRRVTSIATFGAVDMRTGRDRVKRAQAGLLEYELKAIKSGRSGRLVPQRSSSEIEPADSPARQYLARIRAEQATARGEVPTIADPLAVAAPAADLVAELTKLGELFKAGVLTAAEFSAAKAKLVN